MRADMNDYILTTVYTKNNITYLPTSNTKGIFVGPCGMYYTEAELINNCKSEEMSLMKRWYHVL